MSDYFEPEVNNDGGEYIITNLPDAVDAAVMRLNKELDTLIQLLSPFDDVTRNNITKAFDEALDVYATNQTRATEIIVQACPDLSRLLQSEIIDTVMLVRSRMNCVELAIQDDPELASFYVQKVLNSMTIRV